MTEPFTASRSSVAPSRSLQPLAERAQRGHRADKPWEMNQPPASGEPPSLVRAPHTAWSPGAPRPCRRKKIFLKLQSFSLQSVGSCFPVCSWRSGELGSVLLRSPGLPQLMFLSRGFVSHGPSRKGLFCLCFVCVSRALSFSFSQIISR